MKKPYEQEIIDRYVYDVVRRLPQAQRTDIEKELRTLIEDLLEERAAGNPYEKRLVDEVLSGLGNPALLATQYRGTDRHLIGGEYYDAYWWILKIVLLCVGAGTVIAAIVSFFVGLPVSAGFDYTRYFIDWLSDHIQMVVSSLFGAFAIITIAFAVMERCQAKISMGRGSWTPDRLPQIPDRKAMIKPSESVISIVALVVFMVLLAVAPHLIGYWRVEEGGLQVISIFNLEAWPRVLPLLLLGFALGIVQEIVKLVKGRYCTTVAAVTAAVNLLSFGIVTVVFGCMPVWNQKYAQELAAELQKTFGEHDLLSIWGEGRFTLLLLGVFFLAYALETAVVFYRTFRAQRRSI